MTPAEFSALGRLAWGAAWQRPMARALGVSLDSVRSMSVGRMRIGDDVWWKLQAAMLARAEEIRWNAKKLQAAAKTR